MKLKERVADGRGVAYVGLAVGITASVLGNELHAYIPPAGAPAGWEPPRGLLASAFLWPVILWIALEIMLRGRWTTTWYSKLVRWGGLSIVAFVAGYVSYRHMYGLLTHWHEEAFTARVGPLAFDGLMVMSAGALLALRVREMPVPVPVVVQDVAKRSTPPPVPSTPVPPPPPAPVPPPVRPQTDTKRPATIGKRILTDKSQTILDALPGTTSELAERTNIKRTSVDYVLKNNLTDAVRQGDDRIWHRVNASHLA